MLNRVSKFLLLLKQYFYITRIGKTESCSRLFQRMWSFCSFSMINMMTKWQNHLFRNSSTDMMPLGLKFKGIF